MNVALRQPLMTREQFFQWAQAREERYEFDGFQPVAMTGGNLRSDFDTLIQNNVYHQLLTSRQKALGTTDVPRFDFRLTTDRVMAERRFGSSAAEQRRRPGTPRRRSRERRHAGAASVRLGRCRFARSDRGRG